MSRGYNWPRAVAESDKFEFGVKSNECVSVKDLLFPMNGSLEEK